MDTDYTVLESIYSNSNCSNTNNSIRLSAITEKLVLSHQSMHIFNMVSALQDSSNNCVLDGSPTGTGKTYTTAAVCRETKRQPFIICLKSNIEAWKNTLKKFGVEPIGVVNYELIKQGKYYTYEYESGKINQTNQTNQTNPMQIVECPYLKREGSRFKWDFSEIGKKNVVMVFDEAHICKKKTSLNAKLLIAAKSIKTILLSATLCDKIEDFGIFGMMLGFYKSIAAGKDWLRHIMLKEKRRLDLNQNQNQHQNQNQNQNSSNGYVDNILHREIFNKKGSRMSLADIDKKLSNIINIECYTVDQKICKEIDKLYAKIHKYETDTVREPIALEALNFEREKIENVKAEIFIEQTISYYENRSSVVIFINYRSTHSIITSALQKHSIEFAIIIGGQTIDERMRNINMFQRNEVRVMVSMIQAGGTSISLDDTVGNAPRISIISPSYTIIELLQALGRIRRSSTKSHTLQKIIYCANTCEERQAEILRTKEEIISLMTGEDTAKALLKHNDSSSTPMPYEFGSNIAVQSDPTQDDNRITSHIFLDSMKNAEQNVEVRHPAKSVKSTRETRDVRVKHGHTRRDII